MKKRVFITTACLLIFLCNHAQTKSVKKNIALSIGTTFPTGEFSSKELYSTSSGFAKAGFSVNILYDHLLGKHFGIAATLRGQRNPLDMNSMENSFSKAKFYSGFYVGSALPQTPPPATSYSTYPNWKFDKASWLMAAFLLGPYGQFPMQSTGKTVFTSKAMLGPIYAESPKLNGDSRTDTATAHIEQTSASAFGLSYLINSSIKYKLNQKICLLIGIEYLGTTDLKFQDVNTKFTAVHFSNGNPTSAQQSSATTDGKQKIATINLNFGIAFRL